MPSLDTVPAHSKNGWALHVSRGKTDRISMPGRGRQRTGLERESERRCLGFTRRQSGLRRWEEEEDEEEEGLYLRTGFEKKRGRV